MSTLFDCHFHVQNLTHPHIEAFVDRLRKDNKILKLLEKPISPSLIDGVLMLGPFIGIYRMVDRMLKAIGGNHTGPTEAHLRILNLLLLMNQPIDEYLKAVNKELDKLLQQPDFKIKGETFEEVLVSALIMDYTDRDYTNTWKTIAYAQESKPVVRQTEDLLAGIKRFNDGLKAGEKRRLSVLPFLGMNPENYGLDKEGNYVILKAKLDKNLLPDNVLVASPPTGPKAMYSPTTGRFEWLLDEMTETELEVLKNAFAANEDANHVAVSKQLLDDLFRQIRHGGATSVQLLVMLAENSLSEFKSKFEWKPAADAKGGEFIWKTDHMSELERKAIIKALKRPTDEEDLRNQSAWNYSVGRIEYIFRTLEDQKPVTIQGLLNKYFGDEHATRAELEKNQTAWNGSIDAIGQGVFAGIKLYPPLGFDPNPDGNIHQNSRKKKAWYLYGFCQKRKIPITVHTSDGGFQIMSSELHYKYTSPKRWLGVLLNFPNLYINFAHNGVQDAVMNGPHEWKKILFEEIICAKENGQWKYPNVYSDVSDLLNSEEAYKQWEEGMAALNLGNTPAERNEKIERIKSRLLFGSDFMINLRESRSYSEYVSRFVCNKPESYAKNTSSFPLRLSDENLRYRMAVENPKRFLFSNG